MKTWSLGVNALPQFRYGTVTVETMPWYVMLGEWLVDGPLSCSHIPDIPLPNILPRKRDTIKGCPCEAKEVHCDNHDQLYTLREWYGDVSNLWHAFVCEPVFRWAWYHPKRKEYRVEIGYDELKKIFYEYDSKYFDDADANSMGEEDEEDEDKSST